MPGTTLRWTAVNFNGNVIRNTSHTSLRCQWKGAGQVHHSRRAPSHILTTSFLTRCHVTIKGENMPDIVLHVELDVTEMMYTPGDPRGDELACIIFKVSLNRPAQWAQNGSKFSQALHVFITEPIL
jgi:hypothetical protein